MSIYLSIYLSIYVCVRKIKIDIKSMYLLRNCVRVLYACLCSCCVRVFVFMLHTGVCVHVAYVCLCSCLVRVSVFMFSTCVCVHV